MKTAEQIKAFAEIIKLPIEALNEAIPVCDKIISSFSDDYSFVKDNLESPEHIFTLADKMNINRDLVMLACSLFLGADAHELYVEKSISEGIYRLSMREITVWTKTCMRMRNHVGLYEYGWLVEFLRASIVRIHRLEFHKISFLKDRTWSTGGITVNAGDSVINIHIPEDGPLKHEDVLESYRQAYRYFDCIGPQAFVCNSWLLYPGHYEFLPQSSNIRKFMDDFDIIIRNDVRNNGDLWRVFGPCGDYDTSKFPRETSLQRGMIEYLDKHDNVTGSGYGIFLFDGESFIK